MSRLARTQRRRLPLLLLLSGMMLFASLGLLVYELLNFAGRENRLAAGISVAGVRVGGLPEDQARATVEEAFAQPITLYYQGFPINLNPNSVGFRLSSAAMFAEARAASEAGGGFWERFFLYLLGQAETVVRDIPLIADYQTTALRAELDNIANRYDQPAEMGGIDVATLTTFSGGSGFEMDMEATLGLIDAALRRAENRFVDIPLLEGSGASAGMRTLEQLLKAYLDSQGFIYDGQTSVASIYIQDLTTGEEININGDVAFTAASTIKVGILLDYFRVKNGDPSVDDAFILANSLLCSANSSSNLIMQKLIGGEDLFRGIQSVTDTLQYSGANNSYLTAPFVDGSPNQQFDSIAPPETAPNPNFNTDPDFFNQTTAEDMGTLFGMIYDCAEHGTGLMTAYPNGEFTQQECRRMIELMSGLELNRLLPAGLPVGTRISHKNGWVGEITGNAGIVFPPNGRDYVISVYIWQDTGATGFQDYIRLWPLIEEISRATWNFFSPEQALLSRRTDLPAVAQECFTTDTAGNRVYVYLPPYGKVNLDDIDANKSNWNTR